MDHGGESMRAQCLGLEILAQKIQGLTVELPPSTVRGRARIVDDSPNEPCEARAVPLRADRDIVGQNSGSTIEEGQSELEALVATGHAVGEKGPLLAVDVVHQAWLVPI